MKHLDQQGYGLIEVLVSMLVFLLGVLGVAGMQGQAIKVTHDSTQRAQAVWMAHEATERMKVNVEGLESGTYQSTATTARSDLTSYCGSPPVVECINFACSTDQMAEFDVHELLCQNAGIINPQLTVACSTTACNEGASVTVTVSWDSRGATAGVFSSRQQLSLSMRR